jgi:hypothetical protein
VAEASRSCDASVTVSSEVLFQIEVADRFTPGLTGRSDRDYVSPPQARATALTLAALLLDAAAEPAGDGPWQRALAGGRRTVRLVVAGAWLDARPGG